jgi:hypothetical protein
MIRKAPLPLTRIWIASSPPETGQQDRAEDRGPWNQVQHPNGELENT